MPNGPAFKSAVRISDHAGTASRAAEPASATRPARPRRGDVPLRPSQVPVQSVLRSPGRPLAVPLRQEMEARLGAGFSDVRIHDDDAARASAAQIGASAYTCGSHVVIGERGAGKHALAHELTHVIQQRQGPVAGRGIGGGLKVSDPYDRDERAAEANAARVMRAPLGEHGPAAGPPAHLGTVVQRNSDAATHYTPPGGDALSDYFIKNHVPDSFTEQEALRIFGIRGGSIKTIIRISGSDAAHEIYLYLLDLDQQASANPGDRIHFTTEYEYPIIEVEESPNHVMSTSSFKAQLNLSASWNGRYYQVYHYDGTFT